MLAAYVEFPSAIEALGYRKETGCGGWIFEDEETGEALIFPPRDSHGATFTASMVMLHPLTRGKSGRLH